MYVRSFLKDVRSARLPGDEVPQDPLKSLCSIDEMWRSKGREDDVCNDCRYYIQESFPEEREYIREKLSEMFLLEA